MQKKKRSAFFRVIISPNQINGLLFPDEEKNRWDKHMEASSFLRFLRYAPMMAWKWSEKPQTTTLEKNNKCVFSSSLDLLLSPDVFMQCTSNAEASHDNKRLSNANAPKGLASEPLVKLLMFVQISPVGKYE